MYHLKTSIVKLTFLIFLGTAKKTCICLTTRPPFAKAVVHFLLFKSLFEFEMFLLSEGGCREIPSAANLSIYNAGLIGLAHLE